MPYKTGRSDMKTPDDLSPEQTELATQLRIPFLTTPFPDQRYVTGVVIGYGPLEDGLVPKSDELLALNEYLEKYCEKTYRPFFREQLRQAGPFDIENGSNMGYFIKHLDETWSYHKPTWPDQLWFPGRSGIRKFGTIDAVITHLEHR